MARYPLEVALLALAAGLPVLGACGTSETPSPAVRPPRLAIAAPAPGAGVFTNRATTIVVRVSGLAAGARLPISITATSGAGSAVVAETGLGFGLGELATASWRPGADALGKARLTASAPGLEPASIEVNVRDPPRLAVQLAKVAPGKGGAAVTLTVEASPSRGARFTRYLWQVEQAPPVATNAPTAKLTIANALQRAIVVEAFDSLGGVARVSGLLLLRDDRLGGEFRPFEGQVPPSACGCRSMVVRAQPGRRSATYCAPARDVIVTVPNCHAVDISDPAVANPCAETEIPFQCELGPVDPSTTHRQTDTGFQTGSRFAYEIEAAVDGDPDAETCTEGQAIQRFSRVEFRTLDDPPQDATATLNNLPASAEPAALPALPGLPGSYRVLVSPEPKPSFSHPQADPFLLGADGYTTPDPIRKRHEPGVVRMFDAPMTTFTTAGRFTRYVDRFRFVAFVGSEAGGYCWCQARYLNEWQVGRPYQPARLTKEAGTCTIEN